MRNPRLRALAEDIDRLLGIAPFDLDADDVRELAEVVLLLVAEVVDVPGLEQRMVAATRVNFAMVEEAIACFDSARSTKAAFDAGQAIEELRCILPAREHDGAGRLGSLKATSTTRNFEELLIYTEGGDVARFHQLLVEAIARMDDLELSNFLGAAQSECSPDGLNGAEAGSDNVRALITTSDPQRGRELLPGFLAYDRPDLQRKRLALGEHYPCVINVGRILAYAKPELAKPLDLRIARCLTHVYGLFAAIQGKASTFAERLGLQEGSYFQQWHEVDATFWRWGKARPDDPFRALLAWLLRLAGYADAFVDWASPVEAAIRGYKLGLEAQWEPKHPERADLKKEWHEERFQRHAVRFLIERRISAFGTKFGSYQPDVLAGDGEEALVIEAKVYRQPEGAAELCKNIGQLLQYLDQQDPGRRGILCIYNFSDVPMIAPREWIANQYMIVAINLCSVTPSEAKKRRVIKAGHGLSIEVEDI